MLISFRAALVNGSEKSSKNPVSKKHWKREATFKITEKKPCTDYLWFWSHNFKIQEKYHYLNFSRSTGGS